MEPYLAEPADECLRGKAEASNEEQQDDEDRGGRATSRDRNAGLGNREAEGGRGASDFSNFCIFLMIFLPFWDPALVPSDSPSNFMDFRSLMFVCLCFCLHFNVFFCRYLCYYDAFGHAR